MIYNGIQPNNVNPLDFREKLPVRDPKSGPRKRRYFRLGHLERIILEFGSRHVFIQSAQVRVYSKRIHGIEPSLKQLHKSLQYLIRKGLVEKVRWGLYRLTERGRELCSFLVAGIRGVRGIQGEIDSPRSPRSPPSPRPARGPRGPPEGGPAHKSEGVGGAVRVRFHVLSSRDVSTGPDFARCVELAYRVLGHIRSAIRSAVGPSRFRRMVGGVRVVPLGVSFGAHGVVGVSGGEGRPLLPLSHFESIGVRPRELGADVVAAVEGAPRFHAKLYVDGGAARPGGAVPLSRWAAVS